MAKLSIAADILILAHRQRTTNILLVQRKNPPFRGHWALPGGFVEEGETLLQGAQRELEEETGLSLATLFPLPVWFDSPGRDPRGRVVSAVFWGIAGNLRQVKAGSDAKKARWFPVSGLPDLAFDHKSIIDAGRAHLNSLYESAGPLLQAAGSMNTERLTELVKIYCKEV